MRGLKYVVAASMLTVISSGNDAIPKYRHYAARERADNCGTYRSVQANALAEVENNKRIINDVVELLKQRRAELENCARAKGFKVVQTEEQDEMLASVCYEAYEAWLAPGYRLEMLKQDNQETRKSLKLLNAVVDNQCAEMRTPALLKTAQITQSAE
jgi:hypothetical protein